MSKATATPSPRPPKTNHLPISKTDGPITTGALHSETVSCMVPVSQETNTQLPDQAENRGENEDAFKDYLADWSIGYHDRNGACGGPAGGPGDIHERFRQMGRLPRHAVRLQDACALWRRGQAGRVCSAFQISAAVSNRTTHPCRRRACNRDLRRSLPH